MPANTDRYENAVAATSKPGTPGSRGTYESRGGRLGGGRRIHRPARRRGRARADRRGHRGGPRAVPRFRLPAHRAVDGHHDTARFSWELVVDRPSRGPVITGPLCSIQRAIQVIESREQVVRERFDRVFAFDFRVAKQTLAGVVEVRELELVVVKFLLGRVEFRAHRGQRGVVRRRRVRLRLASAISPFSGVPQAALSLSSPSPLAGEGGGASRAG